MKKAIFTENLTADPEPLENNRKTPGSYLPGVDSISNGPPPDASIQTAVNLFSHPDYTVGTGILSFNGKVTGSAAVKAVRGLYRRLGIAPDPEDFIPFTYINITLYKHDFKIFLIKQNSSFEITPKIR